MCSDKIQLRLSNITLSGNADLVRVSADKSEYTVRIPSDLVARGKCKITVSNILIQIKNASSASIVPAGSHTALIMTDGLQLLGYNNEAGGNVNVLAEMGIDSNKNDISLNACTPPVFTCPVLPPEITIRKMVYDPSLVQPTAMNAFTTTVVPCVVTLQLEFMDEDNK